MGGDLGQGEGKIMELLSSILFAKIRCQWPSECYTVPWGMMEFPEFVLIAGHSIGIGLGPVMRLGQDDTNRVSVCVTTCSSTGQLMIIILMIMMIWYPALARLMMTDFRNITIYSITLRGATSTKRFQRGIFKTQWDRLLPQNLICSCEICDSP